MAGNSCIWRCDSGSGSEGSNSDKIEFDTGTTPDATGHIRSTRVIVDIGMPENSKPKGNVNSSQDTGVKSIILEIVGHIEIEKSSTRTEVIQTLKEWLLESKTTTTFPKGRFGVRLDDLSEYNLTPTSTRGYLVKDIQHERDGEYRNKLNFIMTLKFNGDIGSAPYNW